VKIERQIGFIVCLSLLLGCGSKEAYYKSVAHDLNATIRLQEEVDSGHKTGNLDPKDTAMRFLNESLNDPGPFEDVRVGKEKKGRVRVWVRSLRSGYELELFRPIRPDSSGIFVVSGYRTLSPEEVVKSFPKEKPSDPSETN
jgi:hypothetical protein